MVNKKKPSKGKGKEKTPRKVSPEKLAKQNKFTELVKSNPTLSANKLLKLAREKGISIGNEKGKDIVREVRDKKKDIKKATRMKYQTPDQAGKRYLSRYSYIVQYEMVDEKGNVTYEYVTVTHDKRMTKARVITEVEGMLYEQGKNQDKYNARYYVAGSARIVQAIRNDNPVIGA